eukprot:gene30473-biopygen19523
MPAEKELARQVIVVIGAGSGIGKETAHRLVKEGAHIVCVDLNEAAAQATAKEITDSGSLVKFQTDKPESLDNTMTITGLADGESILQIDFRAETEVLYGLTSNNRIATIDPENGVATLVSATPFTTATLNQPVMDINPAQDFIRVIDYQPGNSGIDTNILRVDPLSGALIQSDGTLLRFNDSDTNRPSVSISTNGSRRRRLPSPAFASTVSACLILLSVKRTVAAF